MVVFVVGFVFAVVVVAEEEGGPGMKVPWPRIHWGSVVMVSPGTRIRVLEEEIRGRLFGLPVGLGPVEVWQAVSSLEESFLEEEGDEGGRPSSSSSESDGARMIIAMVVEAIE